MNWLKGISPPIDAVEFVEDSDSEGWRVVKENPFPHDADVLFTVFIRPLSDSFESFVVAYESTWYERAWSVRWNGIF